MFTTAEIALETRRSIVESSGGARKMNLDMGFYDDMWIDASTGIEIDAMYFEVVWLEDQIERVWRRHQPSLGCTTAFCHTVQQAQVLYDPSGWFGALQKEVKQPYPEPLQLAIVQDSLAILRNIIPSYFAQLKKAVARSDLVSINHRVGALLASYFDILFAVNRALHPGEKQLVRLAGELPSLPKNFERDVTATLSATRNELLGAVTRQLDALDVWLTREGFDVAALRLVPVSLGTDNAAED